MKVARLVVAVALAGWLAEALASTNGNVDRAIEAYDRAEFDQALESIDAAIDDLGERSELLYDRGLILLAQGDKDEAKSAFERGTEAEELDVKASAYYELGNLALDDEDHDGAIAAYIACLRAAPDHENAKWNLEIAYARKKQKEEEEQEQEQEDQDEEEEQDEDQTDEGTDEQDEQTEGETDEQDQGTDGDGEQEQGETEGEQDEQDQDEQGEQEAEEPEDPAEGEQPQPGEQDSQEQEAQPREIQQADIDAALEQLDQQDTFMMGRPGAGKPVAKDW